MSEPDIIALLRARADELAAWLDDNAATARDEQLHNEPDTSERMYWHLGYHAAMRDIEGLLRRRLC